VILLLLKRTLQPGTFRRAENFDVSKIRLSENRLAVDDKERLSVQTFSSVMHLRRETALAQMLP